MKQIIVKMKKISVTKFSPKEKTVELDIVFNDGSDKEITKKVAVGNPGDLANEVVLAIRSLEKSRHQQFDGESILDSVLNVLFEDEDKTLSRLTGFFSKLCDKVDAIRTSTHAEGYMDMINKVSSMKFEF